MEMRFLGGAREVGRSSLHLRHDGSGVLLDYGMKTGTPPQYPLDSTVSPEAVVATHGHLDHVGCVPTLMDDLTPVHQTPPTRDLARLLAEDTLEIGSHHRSPFSEEDVLRLSQASQAHGYEEKFGVEGLEFEFHDAGHIPGSASVVVDSGENRLLYTGDINGTPTRLLEPASEPPSAETMVVESTYFGHEHPPRDLLEEEFVGSVRETLYEGGDVVIPVFAIGRTQEILMVLEEHDVPCYVDGMGTEVTRILRQHPDYVRDPEALKRAWNHAREVEPRKRDSVLGQGRAVVTTSGMLTGGPAMFYIKRIYDNPANKICLTGYQVEGTPGREALDSKRAEIDGTVLPISAQVELHDFSAHADSEGLKEYVERGVENGVEPVLTVHGDERDCVGFADWIEEELGVEARAPELGEEVVV